MILKTIQWNIGGGKIRKSESDPTLDGSYNLDGLEYIIGKLKDFNADIVTFQESHAGLSSIQAKIIAEEVSYPYWINDEYDDSHIEDGQRLCQSILSKYPINNHKFKLFNNPHFEVLSEKGEKWISHDKGYTSVSIDLPSDIKLSLGTLHAIPFKIFNKSYSDREVLDVLKDISQKVIKSIKAPFLLQGDFNLNDSSLRSYFPNLLEIIDEILVQQSTTPKGRKYDHVLYKGLSVINNKIYDNILTDHYLVYSEFEV